MFRPDLTDYEIYVEALTEKLNEDAIFPMSKTDAVKVAIEKAMDSLMPDVVINKTRKRYIKLNF
jgi:hypothetical protein